MNSKSTLLNAYHQTHHLNFAAMYNVLQQNVLNKLSLELVASNQI
jgi:hypothetical protein